MARRQTSSRPRVGVFAVALLALAGAYAGHARAALASVLDLVPADAVGVVRARDLRALSDNIDAFAAAVLPAQMEAEDVLARTLARFVGAGFTSLDGLSEHGFRLDTGVAFVFLDANLDSMTAIIGVSDEDAARADLLDHIEGESREYEGFTYTRADEASFAIVDGFLAFSTGGDGLLKVLDVAGGAAPSMGASTADGGRARGVLDSGDDLSLYVDMDAAEPTLLPKLEEWVEKTGDSLSDESDDPDAGLSPDEVNQSLASLRMMVTDLDALGVSLSIDDIAIRWHGESVVRPGSAWAEQAGLPNVSLQQVAEMPGDAFLVSSSVFSGRAMRMSMQQSAAATADPATAAFAAAFEAIPDDYNGQVSMVMRLSETVLVDALVVAPLNGAAPSAFESSLSEAVGALVDAISAGLEDSEEFRGEVNLAEIVEEVEAEYSLGVVKGWRGALPAEMLADDSQAASALLPSHIGVWYSIVDGDAYIAVGATPGDAAAAIEGYREPDMTVGERLPASLRTVLAEEGSGAVVMSPNMLFKAVISMMGVAVPEMQALEAFVQFLPDEHGVAAVTTNRGDGHTNVGAIDAAGLAPLVQFGAMAFAGMQAPGQTGP